MTTDAADIVVERLWVANEARVRGRFLDVLEVLDSLAAQSRQADVGLGIRQARTLVDVLGVYGRIGSGLLQDVEQCLAKPVAAVHAADLSSRVRRLLADLHFTQTS